MCDSSLFIIASIPVSIVSGAEPGTEAFRIAMRDSLENLQEVLGVHGVFNTSIEDHNGMDERSRVVIKIEDGKWVYDPDLE